MSEIIQQLDTRRAFIESLIGLAEKDSRIVLVVCDVGFNYLEEFEKKFPDRFYNLGVTEQSAMLVCAGLGLAGYKPYFYSMLNFSVFRPFEMVRNGVALHKADVKIMGVKGSDKYKFLGFSHNMVISDEDFYHLKPYMDCHEPKTLKEVDRIIRQTYQSNEPCYIRL